MKPKTQKSLLKWSSLLTTYELTSIVEIQSVPVLLKMLNVIQPHTFQELENISQRATNSAVSILNFVGNYYKKQLNCDVTSLIEDLNIFKTPLIVWQLLIGVAIKGKNRDSNINFILQMQHEEQSQLMPFVGDVIQKLNSFQLKQPRKNSSQLSQLSDDRSKGENKQILSNINSKNNEFLNQIIEQNQALKQKIIELQNELSNIKAAQEQSKKTYEDRLNHYKNQRYQFLQVLTEDSLYYNNRKRKKSEFNFRESLQPNQSKIYDDPLHDLSISLTGSLHDIARDILTSVKILKKELQIQTEKSSLLEDHNKDIKLSLSRLIEENKILKQQLEKSAKVEKQLEIIKLQNQELLKNQNELIKMINQVEKQKLFLRETVEKLKQQKNDLLNKKNNFSADHTKNNMDQKRTSTYQGFDFLCGNQYIDLVRAPSILQKHMNSQFQGSTSNLNDQIADVKYPIIRQKYEKELLQLKEKNNLLRQQNNDLKQMNKMLQKTLHMSMQKSQQIQKDIEEGYKTLFDVQLQQIEQSRSISSKQQPGVFMKIIQEPEEQGQKKQEKQQKMKSEEKLNSYEIKNSRMVNFYDKVKKMIDSYEQKEVLMIIQIESLKKQLNNLSKQKMKNQEKSQKQINFLNKNQKQSVKSKRDLQISHNFVENKIQPQQNKLLQNIQEMLFLQSQPPNNLTQNDQKREKKDQSFFVINIKDSEPVSANQSYKHSQKYKITKDKVFNLNQQIIQAVQFKERTQNELSRPSEQLLEIQEGDQFNQNDIPIIRKSHSNSQNSIQDVVKDIQYQRQSGTRLSIQEDKGNMFERLGNRISSDFRRDYFAKSGFYNSSFIELSDRLQLEINESIQDLSKDLIDKNKKTQMQEQGQDNHDKKQQIENNENIQNEELVKKLQKIKESYGKIQKFHQVSSTEVETQLKKQQTIAKSEVVQLKIMNQSLKQSLVSIIVQKQLTVKKIKELKHLAQNISSNKESEELSRAISEMFDNVCELAHIMPELQSYFETSKAKELEILYKTEKMKREQLEQEIQFLMETIIYFRNLSIEEGDQK